MTVVEAGIASPVVDMLRAMGWTDVSGVFVGGCVNRGVGSSFRAMAHTHTKRDELTFRWICVRSGRRVLTEAGKPSRLLLHEVAHVIAPQAKHHGDKAFIAALAAVGIKADKYSRAGRRRVAEGRLR